MSADSVLVDIICYVSVNAGPVYCLSCLCLHLLHPQVGPVQVSNGTVKESWGNVDAASLEEEAGLYGQLILGVPEVLGYP